MFKGALQYHRKSKNYLKMKNVSLKFQKQTLHVSISYFK